MFRNDYILREIEKAVQLLEKLLHLQTKGENELVVKETSGYFNLDEVQKFISVKESSVHIDESIANINGWQQWLETCSDMFRLRFEAANNKADLLFAIQILKFVNEQDKTTFSIERFTKYNKLVELYKKNFSGVED